MREALTRRTRSEKEGWRRLERENEMGEVDGRSSHFSLILDGYWRISVSVGRFCHGRFLLMMGRCSLLLARAASLRYQITLKDYSYSYKHKACV